MWRRVHFYCKASWVRSSTIAQVDSILMSEFKRGSLKENSVAIGRPGPFKTHFYTGSSGIIATPIGSQNCSRGLQT